MRKKHKQDRKSPKRFAPESMEDLICQWFEENFARLRFESGHGLAPELKDAAKRQVLLYWRRLKELAESVTETEVTLNLPGQKTPKGRMFSIEGVVDIVRESHRTTMYDLKTHDPDHVRKNVHDYERQLNIYAYIWQKLRTQQLDATAVIATRFPDSLNDAWENRDSDVERFEEELAKWNPLIPISFNTDHIQDTIAEFGQVIDAIEDGEYHPLPVAVLKKGQNESFASRVCRNCDVRFSCSSYRQYTNTSRSAAMSRR